MAETITSDLCVIGGGLGGLTAAAEARALGASVVLIERDKLGGNYLNTGTVPSRALAAAAAHAQAMRSGGSFGIAGDEPRINTRRVHDGLLQIIAALAPTHAIAHVEAAGVQVLKAEAKFIDARTVAAGDIHVRARRIILATGAHATVPAIEGLDSVPFFTTETIVDNTRKLSHLVIIGAESLGLELAQSYRRLGTDVTVVDRGAALAGSDPELAAVALKRLREEGVDVRTETEVVSIQPRSQGIGVVVRTGAEQAQLDVSHILVAGRRIPNLDGLDLEKAGIKRQADGDHLQLTAGLKTTNRRVYAIGDAAGGRPHLAAWHARLVVRNALLAMPVRAGPAQIPTVTFTDPEIAEVGLTEPAARAAHGANFRVVRAAFADNDRAKATREAYGVAKLVFDRHGRIIGAGIVGDRAGELIAVLALALASGLTARHLADFVAPHATLSEIVAQLGRDYFRDRPVSPMTRYLVSLVRLLP